MSCSCELHAAARSTDKGHFIPLIYVLKKNFAMTVIVIFILD